MICPNCGKDYNDVSKTKAIGSVVKRRRCCLNCGEAFYTTERYVEEQTAKQETVKKIANTKAGKKSEALSVPQLKNRNRPIWIMNIGWAIINDYDNGDFYVYTKNGGLWLKGSDCRDKWFAYEETREME